MTQGAGAGGRLPEWISIGLLAGSVPRDVIDDAVRAFGRQARRSDGKLPPHVVVYLVMALALFADDDYEEAITRLSEPLERWGCWDRAWEVPTTSAITQARKRLGSEPLAEIFDRITEPVAEQLTRGAWLGPRRLVSIDGMEWDLPDTESNAEAFGRSGTAANPSAFPKARVLTLVETGSRAPIGAAIGPIAGKRAGEQTLAFQLFERLEEDMLLLADRGFSASSSGALPPGPARTCSGASATRSPSRWSRTCPTAPTSPWSTPPASTRRRGADCWKTPAPGGRSIPQPPEWCAWSSTRSPTAAPTPSGSWSA
ncbi:transposase domain-containing protein [Streptomyces sp. CA-106131]|uniref:transposase domain-containing protein n=1 Tax=Streptomyces sp. CA-106131 TaxID=3240045 RepID=UPI003D8E5E99